MQYLVKLLFLFFICFSLNLNAQSIRNFEFANQDTSSLTILRNFNENDIDIYKQDSDFIYTEARQGRSEWMEAFSRFLIKLFGGVNTGLSSKIFKYLIIGGAFIALIWFLISTQSSSILSSKNTESKRYVEELDIRVNENILVDKMNKAEADKSFRDAIRYAYLLNLKSLNETEKIVWKEYKLSIDYLSEMKDPKLKKSFKNMTKYFNFAWYGKREISAEMYKKVKDSYEDIMKSINKTV